MSKIMKNVLPKGWSISSFDSLLVQKDIGLVRNRKSQNKEFSFKYIKMNNISNDGKLDMSSYTCVDANDSELKKFTLKKDDFLFNTRNSYALVGKSCIVNSEEKNLLFNNNILRARFTDEIIPSFINYLFQGQFVKLQLNKFKNSTTNVCAIYYKNLQTLEIPFPPLPEQQRIVKKLDALFARIDEAIQLVEANLDLIPSLKMALLEKAFKGQLFGEVALGKNGLPLGWELTTIDKAATIRPKKSEVKEIDDETPISFVPMAFLNANNIQFNHQTEKPLKDVYKGYTYFKDGDVLLAKVTPCFENGKAGIAKGLTNSIGFGSSEFHIVRPKEGILAEWIYYTFLTSTFKAEGKRNFTGSSGLKRVPHAFIQKYKIPLPPIKEQKNIINTLNQIFDKLGSVKTENQSKQKHLQDLKKSLLEQAFQGKL